jgi:hypothetical protein
MRRLLVPAGVLAASLAAAAPAAACSLFPGVGMLGRGTAAMLVVPTADTLRAGDGAVRPTRDGGHFGPTRRGETYGQVVEVAAWGGPAGAGRSPGRAVLVPWDYDPACDPTAWGRSAAWLRPGVQDVVTGVLRAPEHWVDGLPTFDVHMPQLTRGGGEAHGRGEAKGPDAASVADRFGMLSALPVWEEMERDPWGAMAPLRAWVAANPRAARQEPLRASILQAYRYASDADVTRAPSPLAGTYRVEVQRTGGPVHVLYARTERTPFRSLWPSDLLPIEIPMEAPGYALRMQFRRTEAELPPPGRPVDLQRMAAQGGDLTVRYPVREDGGVRRHGGFLEPVNFVHLFADDRELDRIASALLRKHGFQGPDVAAIELGADGAVRLSQVETLGPGEAVTVRAERISRVTWEARKWTPEDDGRKR